MNDEKIKKEKDYKDKLVGYCTGVVLEVYKQKDGKLYVLDRATGLALGIADTEEDAEEEFLVEDGEWDWLD